jgi:hypothetical protein
MSSRFDAMRQAASRGDSVRRRDYCGAVQYVGEAAASVPVADAVSAYESADGFLRMTGRINGCGVYQYEDEDGNTWGELRLPEHVFAEDVLAGWKLAPLTDDHPDEFVTADNWASLAKGGLGSDVRPDDAREYTLADIGCNDGDLIAKVKAGKTALSCGYLTTLVEQPGEYNGVPYRFIQTKYVPNHVSVVDEARGPGCEFVIDGVRSVRSRPTALPKGDEMAAKKTPEEGKNKDAKVMVGETEMEVPEEIAALIESLKAKVEEQGAKLAELAAGGDAEGEPAAPPAEAPMVDADPAPAADGKKPKPSTDSLEARLLMLEERNRRLEAEAKEARDGLGPKVDARVNLLGKARGVLGDKVSLDGKSDTEIKRLVIAAVAPSVNKALDGKSADAVETAYEMALEQHARSRDSSAELLAVATGFRPVRATDNVDLNAAAKRAMDSLATSYNKPSRGGAAMEN